MSDNWRIEIEDLKEEIKDLKLVIESMRDDLLKHEEKQGFGGHINILPI